MTAHADPVATLTLRFLYQDDRTWLLAAMDGAPLPQAELFFDPRLPDTLRTVLHTLEAWSHDSDRPEGERAAVEEGIGRTLAGILFSDDALLRSLAGWFPQREAFSSAEAYRPDAQNLVRHYLESWLGVGVSGFLRVLVIDGEHPHLAGLPWEMLTWSVQGHAVQLGLDPRFTLTRQPPQRTYRPVLQDQPKPLRITYVAAREQNPKVEAARLDHERHRLQSEKRQMTLHRLAEVLATLPGGTTRYLRQVLDTSQLGAGAGDGEPSTVLHVEGHGVLPKDGWEGLQTFAESPQTCLGSTADGDLSPLTLAAADLLADWGGSSLPALAFLATCYGAQDRPADRRRESRRTLGERLLELGVGAVVGTNGGVLTAAVPDLVGDFYGEIARGASVDQAVQAMRRRLYRRGQREAALAEGAEIPPERWWRPMLLAHHSAALRPFNLAAAAETAGEATTGSSATAILRLALRDPDNAQGPLVALVGKAGDCHGSRALLPVWRQLASLARADGIAPSLRRWTAHAELLAGGTLFAGRTWRTVARRRDEARTVGAAGEVALDVPPAYQHLPWEAAWWPEPAEAVLAHPGDEHWLPVPGLAVAISDRPHTLQGHAAGQADAARRYLLAAVPHAAVVVHSPALEDAHGLACTLQDTAAQAEDLILLRPDASAGRSGVLTALADALRSRALEVGLTTAEAVRLDELEVALRALAASDAPLDGPGRRQLANAWEAARVALLVNATDNLDDVVDVLARRQDAASRLLLIGRRPFTADGGCASFSHLAAMPLTYPETARRMASIARTTERPWLAGLAPSLWWDVVGGFPTFLESLASEGAGQGGDELQLMLGWSASLPPTVRASKDVGYDLRDYLASLAPPIPEPPVRHLVAWLARASSQARQLLDHICSALAGLDDEQRDQLACVATLRGFQPLEAWRRMLGRDPAPLLGQLHRLGLALPRGDGLAADGPHSGPWLLPRVVASLSRLGLSPERLRQFHRQAAYRYVSRHLLAVNARSRSEEEARYRDAAPGGTGGLWALDWFEARYHWLHADGDGQEVHWCDRHIERWLVPRQVPFLMEHSHRCLGLASTSSPAEELAELGSAAVHP